MAGANLGLGILLVATMKGGVSGTHECLVKLFDSHGPIHRGMPFGPAWCKMFRVPNYENDQGICLRVVDFSETSQVATMLTREHGLVPMLAKGIRKISAKSASALGGPLDLLAMGDLVFIPPRSGELATLTAWQIRDHQPAIRNSLTAFYAGQIICECTIAMLSPHDPHASLYDELLAALTLLTGIQAPRALVAYLKCVLVAAGYQARLDTCSVCGTPVTPGGTVRFLPGQGTVVCGNCAGGGPTIATESRIILALHRLVPPTELLARPPSRPADIAALRAAAKILTAQIQALTDRRLRTADLLDYVIKTNELEDRPNPVNKPA